MDELLNSGVLATKGLATIAITVQCRPLCTTYHVPWDALCDLARAVPWTRRRCGREGAAAQPGAKEHDWKTTDLGCKRPCLHIPTTVQDTHLVVDASSKELSA